MTERTPRVSVILTTYNRTNLLPRAIDGVLEQAYRDWELLIVDDASEENTAAVVDEYDDERIRLVEHDRNRGVAAARNTGIEHARGEYVAMLDDDDEWIDDGKLGTQVRALDEADDDVAFVCTDLRIASGDGERVRGVGRPDDLVGHILAHNGIIYSPTVMFRRSVLVEYGGYDERLARGVDSEMYREPLIDGYDALFLDDVTTLVHEHDGPRITFKERVEDYRREIDAIHHLLEKHEAAFERHPDALAYRYVTLGLDRYQIYRLTGDPEELRIARERARQAVRTSVSVRSLGLFGYLAGLRLVPSRFVGGYERLARTIAPV